MLLPFVPRLRHYPLRLQFPVNDRCNSKCEMCSIWEQSERHPISPTEVRQVLARREFRFITNVGLNGGEPTLRKDLGELTLALCDSLARLESVSLISNGLHPPTVKRGVEQVLNSLSDGVSLDLMFSLDGWADTHDRVRGVPGNFESVAALVDEYIHDRRLSRVRLGSTITASNAGQTRELLELCVARWGIAPRFRLAVTHQRLYNQAYGGLDRSQIPALSMFFSHLAGLDCFYDSVTRLHYRSVASQLVGSKRSVGCVFRTNGLVLSSRRSLFACAVDGDAVADSRQIDETFLRNLVRERRRLRDNVCDGCVHDYRPLVTKIGTLSALVKQESRRGLGCLKHFVRSAGVAERFTIPAPLAVFLGAYLAFLAGPRVKRETNRLGVSTPASVPVDVRLRVEG